MNSVKELRAATKSSIVRERTATKIRAAKYDGRRDVIVAELSTGSTLTVPRRSIPGFRRASAGDISDILITPGREGLWSDSVDDGVLLEQLLVLAAGEVTIGTLGARINAAKKSPARAAASRVNGAKGGRPARNSST
ncbi:MAG: hypothetical protein GIW95_04150 [Candidatus Eremiobacteraeota bacterium]|nr:hypothetical protein [Candidatus Eremiobacteraeota bacterium]